MKPYKGILIASFLVVAGLSGLFIGTSAETSSISLAGDPLYYLYTNTSAINIDGTINPGEYPDSFPVYSVGGKPFANLAWAHSNGTLYVGISANVSGWIGFGQGDNGMLNAPMIYGSVTDGNNLKIFDAFGPSDKNTFPSFDSGASPSGDIIQSAGTEANKVTTIEFAIPLNSTDPKDAAWGIGGTYSFFLAADKKKEVTEMNYHTVHSARNLKVKILDETVAPPDRVELSAPTSVGTGVVNLSSTATVNSIAVAGVAVTFVLNTSFGFLELGDAVSGADGVATLTNVDLGESVTLVGDSAVILAIHKPSQKHSYAISDISTIAISGEDIEQFYEEKLLDPPEYDQFVFNPNYFDNSGRLALVIMLFLLIFVVFMLTWEYGKAVVNWVEISKLGRGIEREEDDLL